MLAAVSDLKAALPLSYNDLTIAECQHVNGLAPYARQVEFEAGWSCLEVQQQSWR